MATSDTDHDLLEALKRGEQRALADLYDRYASMMLGVAFRLLNNSRDAEDLLHDVFLEAWQKAATYDASRGSVKAWLMIRLRSRASDRRRTLATARDKAVLLQPLEVSRSSDNEVLDLTEQAHTHELLHRLDPEQRQVIELAYFEGLSGRDIAQRCNVPIGTVKSRLSRAIVRLREVMESK